MALSTDVQVGDPDHEVLHNQERAQINANEIAAEGAVPLGDGVRVVVYGTNVNLARPSAAVVWWVGSVGAGDPVNANTGDAISIPNS